MLAELKAVDELNLDFLMASKQAVEKNAHLLTDPL
jgi:hypothetical protein